MEDKKTYDIAVIGAGPGGYVAAIKAAQLGKSVALIEKNYLGGTCLNVGCIPTKTLLANSSLLKKIKDAKNYGISIGELSFDYSKMKQRKDDVILKIRTSLEGLLKQNKIEIFMGHASFTSPKEIKIKGEKNLLIQAKKIIIATGSEPLDIKSFPCDHKKILNSTSILEITELPKSIAIVGGGYIGCEFASLFVELGVKVTIIEALDSILTLLGPAIAGSLQEIFTKQGMEIRTKVSVKTIEKSENHVKIILSDGKEFDADMALISIGRKTVSSNMDIEKAGVKVNEKGMIEVNEKMESSVPNIYAIGDVTGELQLAHVASHQGIVAAINACGGNMHMDYHAAPAVVFTTPEIAFVGLTLEQAKEKGYNAATGAFPFQALGKSLASGDTEGFAQIIIDKTTGQILGAQVVGHEASTLIAELTLALQNELTVDCIAETIHAHPTVSEAWLEAALIAKETPIHFPPQKRVK